MPDISAPDEAWVRRLVTVLAVEVTLVTLGSEAPDEERKAGVIHAASERIRRIVEAHGGKLVTGVGGASIALFGTDHGDPDHPLRAATAALEIVRVIGGGSAAERRGLFASAKAAVAAGRAVTAGRDEAVDAAGDLIAAAIAARSTAQPGTVAVDRDTYALISDAIDVTEVPGLDGFRVHAVRPRVRSHGASLVGRDLELAAIHAAFATATAEGRVETLTLTGDAGVGKSRLVQEAMAHLERATVVGVRCSGEGSSDAWAPAKEIVERLLGPDGDAGRALGTKLRAAPADERPLIEQRLSSLLRPTETPVEMQELFWAVRRLIEIVATERPMVIVMDDLQWAEQSMLDLIAYVGSLSRGAPILLLCLGRSDLLERHPGWPGTGVSLTLRPLTRTDVEAMLGDLAYSGLTEEQSRTLLDLSGGNPLFVEEGAAVLSDPAVDALPPTLQGIAAARMERLPEGDLAVARVASIIEAPFPLGSLIELAAGEGSLVESAVDSLVSKGILTRDDGTLGFKHLVLRQAAYDTLPLGPRAEAHERFAQLLLESRGDEADPVTIGHHLEAASRALEEIDPGDAHREELAGEAAVWLDRAGRRAIVLGDISAAAALLQRAAALMGPAHPGRVPTLLSLAEILVDAGDPGGARVALDEIGNPADEVTRARKRVQEINLFMLAPTGDWHTRVREEAGDCLAIFEAAADDEGVVACYRILAEVEWENQRFAAGAALMQKALERAAGAGLSREAEDAIGWLLAVEFWGPTPVGEAIARVEEVLSQAVPGSTLETKARFRLGCLRGMQGRFDEARTLQIQALKRMADVGLHLHLAAHAQERGLIEMLARKPGEAEAILREGYERCVEMGETSYAATTAALLARALYGQGRLDEAIGFTEVSEKARPEDPAVVVEWGPIRAKILAERGRLDEAQALARKVLELVEGSDDVLYRGNAAMDAAAVFAKAGNTAEARRLLTEAASLYERKGVVPLAERAAAAAAEVAAT